MTSDPYSRATLRQTIAAGVLITATLILIPAALQGQQETAVTLRPGILVQPSRGVAYVMTPDGGIAAVDLAKGEMRWTTREAAKPLALVGNLLVAQVEPKAAASRLELVSLDTQARGARVARAVSELPSGVRVSIGETLQGTFSTDARASGTDVIVNWSFVRVPRKGMLDEEDKGAAAPRGLNQPPQITRGAVRMQVATGALSQLDPATPAAPPHRWVLRPAEKMADVPPTQYESADSRYVLASEVIGDDTVWQKYRWTVYERSTGRKVGEYRTHVSFTPFIVSDSLLIYETTPYTLRGASEEPAKVRAVGLESGQQVWSVQVREIVYRGPFPP